MYTVGVWYKGAHTVGAYQEGYKGAYTVCVFQEGNKGAYTVGHVVGLITFLSTNQGIGLHNSSCKVFDKMHSVG